MQKVYCRLSYAEDDCHAMEQTMNVHELADTIVQRYLAHPGGKMYPELMAQIEPLLASSLQEATRAKDERIAELERIVRQSLVDHESVKFSDLFGSRVQVSEPCDCYRCEEIRAALSNTSPPLQGAKGGK
jgi:hypothetical protein